MPSGLVLSLEECYYVPTIRRNIISISCLDKKGFEFIIKNNKCNFYLDNIFYGYAPCISGLYVLDTEETNEMPIYNFDTKSSKSNDLNSTYLWHYRLGHINEKRISKLHQNGLLNSFDTCEPCLLGKMTKTLPLDKVKGLLTYWALYIQMYADH